MDESLECDPWFKWKLLSSSFDENLAWVWPFKWNLVKLAKLRVDKWKLLNRTYTRPGYTIVDLLSHYENQRSAAIRSAAPPTFVPPARPLSSLNSRSHVRPETVKHSVKQTAGLWPIVWNCKNVYDASCPTHFVSPPRPLSMMNSKINETAREADGDCLSRSYTKLACFSLRKNNSYPVIL